MAINDNSSAFLHVLMRAGGITGLLLATIGLGVIGTQPSVFSPLAMGMWAIIFVGGFTVFSWLVLEMIGASSALAGRRGAVGTNAVLQVFLAVGLVLVVNGISYFNYHRVDWTRDKQFTVPESIRTQLLNLRDETTIVLHLRHMTFGQTAANPDNFGAAAERKVVEKVKDIVEQFQHLGPSFRVVQLDIQEEKYKDRRKELTQDNKALEDAIERSTENCIFFTSGKRVSHLSFQEVYQLDKKSSNEAHDSNGNLVLYFQGWEPFARKILNVDEKAPKIAVATVHELLTLQSDNPRFTLSGVKRVLDRQGLQYRDLILKRWGGGPPQPTTMTFEENRLDDFDAQVKDLEESVEELEKEVGELREAKDAWEKKSLKELANHPIAKLNRIPPEKLTDELRAAVLKQVIAPNLAFREAIGTTQKQSLDELKKERQPFEVAADSLSEERRIQDLKAKTERILADCDLLILPRMTLLNAARGEFIEAPLHNLDRSQTGVIQGFLKAGKPVLFCLGPSSMQQQRVMQLMQMGIDTQPDVIESKILPDLGFQLPSDTILFHAELPNYSERRSIFSQVSQTAAEVPPAKLDWEDALKIAGAKVNFQDEKTEKPKTETKVNPIRESLRLLTASIGKNAADLEKDLDLKLRNPRPVYFDTSKHKLTYQPEFMRTGEKAWNTSNPFSSQGQPPRYKPPEKPQDDVPIWERRDEGSFPIAAAVETTPPESWYANQDEKRVPVRVAVIGHGGVFVGDKLSPTREKLFLDVTNWLLGRDDLLAKQQNPWQFPRVEMSRPMNLAWNLTVRFGLPLLSIYVGCLVWLCRRLR